MGYYDKGSYSTGAYNPDEERESARERYLDLLAKQRMGDQAMTDRMDREAARKNREMSEQKQDASGQAAGDMAARGGQMGGQVAGMPGAIIGGIIGKSAGAVQHGKKYGAWEGVKAALNPFSTPKAMLGFGGAGATGAGSGVANQVGEQREDAKRNRLTSQLESRSRFEDDFDGMGDSSQLDEPSLGDSLNQPQRGPYNQGDLALDDEFAMSDEEKAYYGRYGR